MRPRSLLWLPSRRLTRTFTYSANRQRIVIALFVVALAAIMCVLFCPHHPSSSPDPRAFSIAAHSSCGASSGSSMRRSSLL